MRRIPAIVVVLVLGSGACSLGAREQRAEYVEGSVERLAGLGPVEGRYTVGFEVVELPPTSTVSFGTPGGATSQRFPDLAIGMMMDVSSRRAALSIDEDAFATEASAAPVVDLAGSDDRVTLFVHDVFDAYSFRLGRTTSISNRNWSRLDILAIDDDPELTLRDISDRLGVPLLGIVNPVFVAELAVAVLDGSIDETGTDTIGDDAVTVYQGNISLEQYLIEIDPLEPERRALERVFGNVAVEPDAVAPATFWIDEAGALRRLAVTFSLHPARRTVFELTYTVDVTDVASGAIEVPAPDDTVSIETVGQLIQPFRSNA